MSKHKPDYKGFYIEKTSKDELGVPFSLNDLIRMAFKYHCPIPKYVITSGRVRRDDLVEKLAGYWRVAENWYLETGSDSLKERTERTQKRLHLNEHEVELLEGICSSMGI